MRNNTKFFKQKLIIINVCALYKFVLSIIELSTFLNRVGKVFTNIHYFLFLSFLKSFFLKFWVPVYVHRHIVTSRGAIRNPIKSTSRTRRESASEREREWRGGIGVEWNWDGSGRYLSVNNSIRPKFRDKAFMYSIHS